MHLIFTSVLMTDVRRFVRLVDILPLSPPPPPPPNPTPSPATLELDSGCSVRESGIGW